MKLLEPSTINNLRLKNRMVFLATHLNYCDEGGEVTEKLLAFYKERAKYKPGLIIVGGCYTEHLGMSLPTMIGISKDEHIPGLKKLAEVMHSFEVPVAAPQSLLEIWFNLASKGKVAQKRLLAQSILLFVTFVLKGFQRWPRVWWLTKQFCIELLPQVYL